MKDPNIIKDGGGFKVLFGLIIFAVIAVLGILAFACGGGFR